MTHSTLLTEYTAAHQPGQTAVYDRSSAGLLELRGSDRVSFLQGMVSNDVAALTPGQSCHATLLDSTGHLQADLRVHAFPDCLRLETDLRCLATLSETLDKFLIMEEVEIADVSALWVILSVLGEGASELLAHLPDLSAAVRPLSYPLASGFDLWASAADGPAAWKMLLAAGAISLGEEAAEVLRVEAAIPAWGCELTPTVLLPETGMEDAVSYTKGCYVGQEIVARLHARGHANRALRQILLNHEAPVPPPGVTIHVPEDGPEPGREIGRITSAVASPRFGGRALALAYVRKEYWDIGTPISVQIEQPGGLMFAYRGSVQ